MQNFHLIIINIKLILLKKKLIFLLQKNYQRICINIKVYQLVILIK